MGCTKIGVLNVSWAKKKSVPTIFLGFKYVLVEVICKKQNMVWLPLKRYEGGEMGLQTGCPGCTIFGGSKKCQIKSELNIKKSVPTIFFLFKYIKLCSSLKITVVVLLALKCLKPWKPKVVLGCSCHWNDHFFSHIFSFCLVSMATSDPCVIVTKYFFAESGSI